MQAGTTKVFNDFLPEAQHVFFSRFCLVWCNAAESSGILTPREKCMLPLYNMEEFAERYSCKGRANFTTADLAIRTFQSFKANNGRYSLEVNGAELL